MKIIFFGILLAFSSLATADVVSPDTHISLAEQALKDKDNRLAVKLLNKVLKTKPNHFKAGWLLFKALEPLGEAEDIRLTLENLNKLKPKDIDVLSQLCKTYYHQKFVDKAMKTCKEAIKQDSSYATNHNHLAYAYWDYGKKNIALNIVKTIIKKFPENSSTHNVAGDIYLKNKNTKLALDHYLKSANIDSTNISSHLEAAKIYFDLKDYKNSLKHYEHSCSINSQKTKSKLRYAATKLRLQTNDDWSSAYSIALNSCYTKKSPDK